MDKAGFRARYGSVYEHSPWVAEAAFDQNGDLSADALALTESLKSVFITSPRDQQEATLRAHPQLACAIENRELLTDDSVAEQTGAGLDRCSADEFSEFALLNKTYIEKFGFPFIIAVKGHDRYSILKNFRSRLQNSPQLEFETAVNEVCRIAKFRIEGIASV